MTRDIGAGLAEPPLWRATVPVFDAALARLDRTVAKAVAALGPAADAAFARRPAPRMLPAGQQVAMAAQFTLRVAYPLVGRRAPVVRGALDAAGLAGRIAETRALLAALPAADFAGAECRRVRYQAGFADLEHEGEAFLHGFGLPNFYFHHAMAHVALKQAGVSLGKADFDGLHDYPEDFSLG